MDLASFGRESSLITGTLYISIRLNIHHHSYFQYYSGFRVEYPKQWVDLWKSFVWWLNRSTLPNGSIREVVQRGKGKTSGTWDVYLLRYSKCQCSYVIILIWFIKVPKEKSFGRVPLWRSIWRKLDSLRKFDLKNETHWHPDTKERWCASDKEETNHFEDRASRCDVQRSQPSTGLDKEGQPAQIGRFYQKIKYLHQEVSKFKVESCNTLSNNLKL